MAAMSRVLDAGTVVGMRSADVLQHGGGGTLNTVALKDDTGAVFDSYSRIRAQDRGCFAAQ